MEEIYKTGFTRDELKRGAYSLAYLLFLACLNHKRGEEITADDLADMRVNVDSRIGSLIDPARIAADESSPYKGVVEYAEALIAELD